MSPQKTKAPRQTLPSVLIADGDQDTLYSFRRTLHKLPLDLSLAASCSQAIDSLETQPPDLILTDVRVGPEDGFQILQASQRTAPRRPVLMMSTGELRLQRKEAFQAGALDLLHKPLTATTLRHEIERGLWIAAQQKLPPADWPQSAEAIIPSRPGSPQAFTHQLWDLAHSLEKNRQSQLRLIWIQGEDLWSLHRAAFGFHRIIQGSIRPPRFIIPDQAASLKQFTDGFGKYPGPVYLDLSHKEGSVNPDMALAWLEDLPKQPPLGWPRLLVVLQQIVAETEDSAADSVGSAPPWIKTLTIPHPTPLSEEFLDLAYLMIAEHIAKGTSVPTGLSKSRKALKSKDLAVCQQLKVHSLDQLWSYVQDLTNLETPTFLKSGLEVLLAPKVSLPKPASARAASALSFSGEQEIISTPVFERVFEEIQKAQPLPEGLDSFDLIERYLINRSLQEFHGNQSRAARFLGITRNTLRKRVGRYNLGEEKDLERDL